MQPIPTQASWHLGSDFPTNVMILALRDPTFLQEVYDCLHPTYFEADELVILAEMTLKRFGEVQGAPTKDELIAMAYEKAKAVDRDSSLGLHNRLYGWIEHLYTKQVPEPEFVKQKVRDFGRRREVVQAVNQALCFLEQDSPEDGEKTIEKISDVMNAAFTVGYGRNFGVNLHDIGPELPKRLREDALYGMDHKVPTGIPRLDKIMNGGAGVGEICVVAGPPNRGKSTILAALGRHAAGHFKQREAVTGISKAVVHITCEMHENDIALKYMSNMTGIPQNEVMQSEAYETLQGKQLPLHCPVIIKYYSPGTASVDDIKWFLSNLVVCENIKPGLLVLDYADRLRGGEDDRFRGMGKIYDELIATGDKFGIPVWTGSQINREKSESKVIKNDGIAESWKKIEAADLVMTLCQDDNEYQQNIMRLHLPKVRRGQARETIYCHCHPETATIWEMTDAELVNIGGHRTEPGVDTEIPLAEPPPDSVSFKTGGGQIAAPPPSPVMPPPVDLVAGPPEEAHGASIPL